MRRVLPFLKLHSRQLPTSLFTFVATALLFTACPALNDTSDLTNTAGGGGNTSGAKCASSTDPSVLVAFFDPNQLSLGGSGFSCVGSIVLRDPNHSNTVVASFNNIKVNPSGTYLTADPISVVGDTIRLVAGVAYDLLISNANGAVVSSMTISSIGGPAQIANGYLNGIAIGNTAPPANTSAGRQGILFTDGAGFPWIGAVNSTGNILIQTGGTLGAPNGVATLVANSATGMKGTFGVGTTAPSSGYGLDVRGMINSSLSSSGLGGGIALTNTAKTNAYNASTPQNMTWRIVNTTSPYSDGLEFQTIDVNGSGGTGARMRLTDAAGARINDWLDVAGSACGLASFGNNLYLKQSDNAWKYANTHATIGGTAIQMGVCGGTGGAANQIMFLRANTPGTAGGTAAVSESMRIDHNGNLGIGTSTPAAKLDVAGKVKLGVGGYAFSSMQAGAVGNCASPGGLGTSGSVTFGTAFSGSPLVFIQLVDHDNAGPTSIRITPAPSSTGFSWQSWTGGVATAADCFYWMAIGP
ncbi:MAG: hypothetical protein HYX67_09970 [Candidatus Melainabacteria bacterium]|nr:hypothetical protein [Candidatus Melainabacteria bacterium]